MKVDRSGSPFYFEMNGAPQRSNRPAQLQIFPDMKMRPIEPSGFPHSDKTSIYS
jgi:hypothetical protein